MDFHTHILTHFLWTTFKPNREKVMICERFIYVLFFLSQYFKKETIFQITNEIIVKILSIFLPIKNSFKNRKMLEKVLLKKFQEKKICFFYFNNKKIMFWNNWSKNVEIYVIAKALKYLNYKHINFIDI